VKVGVKDKQLEMAVICYFLPSCLQQTKISFLRSCDVEVHRRVSGFYIRP